MSNNSPATSANLADDITTVEAYLVGLITNGDWSDEEIVAHAIPSASPSRVAAIVAAMTA